MGAGFNWRIEGEAWRKRGWGKGLNGKEHRIDVGEGEQGEEREEREEMSALNVMDFLAKMRLREEGEKKLIRRGEHQDGETEREKKSALFHIGSNRDNGSESAGSEFDASGLAGWDGGYMKRGSRELMSSGNS